MEDEKWKDITGRIQDEFEVLEHETRDLEEGPGNVEYFIFQGPLGKMRVERVSKPLVLGVRGMGSRRIGSQAQVQYQYSDSEWTHGFHAYRWDDGRQEWIAMEATGSFNL